MPATPRLVLVMLALLAVAGCSNGAPAGTSSAASGAQLTAVPASPSPTAAPAASPSSRPSPSPIASTSPIYDPSADAAADIDAALALAKADGKPVLIDFGADWCPDCVALSRMMETEAFRAWLAGVHVVRVDVGKWDHNMDISAAAGNAATKGIPAVVLVAPDGKILGSTADGRLANAATMTPSQVLAVLKGLGG